MNSKLSKLKGKVSRNNSKKPIPIIKKDNLKALKIGAKMNDSPFNM